MSIQNNPSLSRFSKFDRNSITRRHRTSYLTSITHRITKTTYSEVCSHIEANQVRSNATHRSPAILASICLSEVHPPMHPLKIPPTPHRSYKTSASSKMRCPLLNHRLLRLV